VSRSRCSRHHGITASRHHPRSLLSLHSLCLSTPALHCPYHLLSTADGSPLLPPFFINFILKPRTLAGYSIGIASDRAGVRISCPTHSLAHPLTLTLWFRLPASRPATYRRRRRRWLLLVLTASADSSNQLSSAHPAGQSAANSEPSSPGATGPRCWVAMGGHWVGSSGHARRAWG